MIREELTIAGIRIFGRPLDHGRVPEGFYVRVGGVKGIDGGVSVRRDALDIPAEHGEFDVPVVRGARAITIPGLIIADSVFALRNLTKQILGVGGDGSLVQISARHQGEWLNTRGRLAGSPEYRDLGRISRPFVSEFDVQFVCPNPRLYGDVTFTGAGEAAVNQGNFPASPVLRVKRVSGSGGYTVSTVSGIVQVLAPLGVGAEHRIDLATGGVYLGGTRLTGALGAFTPWTIPAKSALTHEVTAGCTLTVETTDTYI